MSNNEVLSANQRIAALLDESSFVEIGAAITKRSTDFNMQEKSVPGDGVVTGYGLINGEPVYVYSQDVSALGGSVGEMHAKKIAHIYELAMKTGVPVVGMLDCAGMRLQEGTDALAGFGEIYRIKAMVSGVIPQISAVFGKCGGGAAVLASMSDFTFMEKDNAKLFVNAPNTLAGNYAEKCDTASADFQAESGVVDFVYEGEEQVLAAVRNFMTFLPANNGSQGFVETSDDLNRLTQNFDAEVKDPAAALADLSDGNVFVEVKAGYAKEMVTGFIRLDGMTVGAIANRTVCYDEEGKESQTFDARLTAAGCEKAVSFVKKCNAFNVPILTLTNVEGFAATLEEEQKIAKNAAALTYAFAQADVPKVNLITEKAFGSAAMVMNAKATGADMVFALPDAQIGLMDAKLAAQVMYADDAGADVDAKAAEYAAKQDSVETAAQRGYVDAVIEPASARKQLLYAFEMLYSKSEFPFGKKNGTI